MVCVDAFKHHLSDTDSTDELTQYLREEDHAEVRTHSNVPIAVLQRMADMIHKAWQA